MEIRKYIGIPYVTAGRTDKGCDCYGLVRLVHLEQFGKTLPELSYDADDKEALENLIDEQKALLDVFSVPFPQVGDLVVFSYLGFASHIGVFVGDGKVLHTDRKRFSVLDSLDSPRIRSHIKGYYRVN